jgi:hypothetical protein
MELLLANRRVSFCLWPRKQTRYKDLFYLCVCVSTRGGWELVKVKDYAQSCIVYPTSLAASILYISSAPPQHPSTQQQSAPDPALQPGEKNSRDTTKPKLDRVIQLVTAMTSPSVLAPASPIQLLDLATPSSTVRSPRPAVDAKAAGQRGQGESAHDGEKNTAGAATRPSPWRVSVAAAPTGRLLAARRRRGPPPGRPGQPRPGSDGQTN